MTRFKRVAGLVLALAVIATACGDGSSNEDDFLFSGDAVQVADASQEEDASAPDSDEVAPTTTAPAEAAPAVEPEEDAVGTHDNGNLLVEQAADWSPTFNAGDLVVDSTLCTFFASESEAYAWFSVHAANHPNDRAAFLESLNEGYLPLRIDYWQQVPTAAVNMMEFLEERKGHIPELVKAIHGDDAWDFEEPSATMALVEEMTYTTVVLQPASFRTTGCDNTHDPDQEEFREVFEAQNVVVSPDDPDWVPTLVDVVLPSVVNARLAEAGSDTRLYQVLDDEGEMVYRVSDSDDDVTEVAIEATESVPLIVMDEERHSVIVEGVFSTGCGNPMLPEFSPPRKEPAPTPTTTTRPPRPTPTTTTVPEPTPTTTTMPTPTTTTTPTPTTTTTPTPTTTTTPTPTTTTTPTPTTTTTPTPTTTVPPDKDPDVHPPIPPIPPPPEPRARPARPRQPAPGCLPDPGAENRLGSETRRSG